jgi:hypothetical protein
MNLDRLLPPPPPPLQAPRHHILMMVSFKIKMQAFRRQGPVTPVTFFRKRVRWKSRTIQHHRMVVVVVVVVGSQQESKGHWIHWW